MSLTFVDDFAGAGGASQGLREAGLELVQAANHAEKAIETHSANFPDADHLLTDLLVYDPRRRPRADMYWASPECIWHTPAGGRKRKRQMLDLFDEYVPNDLGDRSRLTMMTVISMAEAKRFPVVLVENVVEVADWELFDVWLQAMGALGYQHQILCVSAAHVWSETNRPAPQWRDRVYFVFYLKGIPFPDVAPRPWAHCPSCGEDVRSVQSWKRPGTRIGKYRAQYVYVCPVPGHGQLEPYVMPALDALDLSDLGTRIADRPLKTFTDKRTGEKVRGHLAPASVRRIKVGGLMFGGAAEVIGHQGHTWDAAKPAHPRFGEPGSYYRVWPATDPLMTRSSTPGDAVVTPFISHQYGEQAGSERRNSDPGSGPLGTVTAGGGHHNLVTPVGVTLRRNAGPYAMDGAPAPTVTAGGRHHGVVTPTPFLSRQYTQPVGGESHLNTPISEPTHTITGSGGNHALVTPTPRPKIEFTEAELDAIDITEWRFRMLQWREHATAQRFPRDYVFTGNSSENTLMAGNAVASNVAHYLGILTRVALGDLTLDAAGLDYRAKAAA